MKSPPSPTRWNSFKESEPTCRDATFKPREIRRSGSYSSFQEGKNTDGSKAVEGMLDATDEAAPGSVYVMALEDGAEYAGTGGLMSTAMRPRGFPGAVVHAGIRDIQQITKQQFPVFSQGVVPSTTVNDYRFAGKNIPVTCSAAQAGTRRTLTWN